MTFVRKTIFYLLLVISGVLIFFPVLFALSVSFTEGAEVLQGKVLPSQLTFDNYAKVFHKLPLLRYLWNSLIVSFLVMMGQLITSSLAAYAFVFIPFRGRQLLFFVFISTMMIPWEATMIPNFLTVQSLGWIDSYFGLTVPFFAHVFSTFLLRQHFKTIPHELREASLIEGVNHFKFFYKVVLPISKVSLVTLGIYVFLTTWNMYLWPLLVTNNDDVRTVQIGLKKLQSQELATDWGVVMAGVVTVILPTLILLFLGQKQLRKGLMQGAIK